MTYEVWDTESGNIVEAYATEGEALALVQRAIDAHGVGYAETLALVLDDGSEDVRTLAIGVELVARVQAVHATA